MKPDKEAITDILSAIAQAQLALIAAERAFQVLIAALRPVSREQVEKARGEWKICFEDWRKQIAGDQCSKCGFQHYGTSINHYHFCPACGSPMTDEAVQMVMERMEKLYEAVE